jgi:hypothetical protein
MAYQPFTYIPLPPTYIRPVDCSHCGAHAHLVRREYQAELKCELRTFRCINCRKEFELTVKD